MKILHIGVPSTKEMPGETYYEAYKEYCTNPDEHPYKLEFYRFPEGCDTFPPDMINTWHICIEVDSVEDTVQEMDEIILPVQKDASPMFAFAKKDGVVFEIKEKL
jgi:hypothetical protein